MSPYKLTAIAKRKDSICLVGTSLFLLFSFVAVFAKKPDFFDDIKTGFRNIFLLSLVNYSGERSHLQINCNDLLEDFNYFRYSLFSLLPFK